MPVVLNFNKVGLPPGAKYIGRGSPYGNPFKVGRDGVKCEVIARYIEQKSKDSVFIEMVKRELRGHDLVCHCKPEACHGDWLLEVANSD